MVRLGMRVLILGGTGTLGRATIRRLLLDPNVEAITCLSRDELKQHELKLEINDPRLHFVLGDIRDRSSLEPHFEHIDLCFHFAALKRIPEMESQPHECIKTNVLGLINAADLAKRANVQNFVFSSTDKACLPVNTYGASKFLGEQILFSMNRTGRTAFSVYRWGNVAGSRGSVIHQFKKSLEEEKKIYITDQYMSRFWIKIEDAVDFMLRTYPERCNFPKIPKMKAAPVMRVASLVAKHIGVEDYVIENIGIRPGEKIHEDIDLTYNDARTLNSQNADQYTNEELLALIKQVL